MEKKRGFTLVELLAVIVLLAIIITIAVPGVTSVSNRLREKMYCDKIDLIENQAKLYGEDRRDSLNDSGIYVTVQQLVETGYLKRDQDTFPYVVDPRDSESTELYNMSFRVFLQYNRAYVEFNDTVKQTCDK